MIAWTDRTHGRGPGFRSRAELRRRRQLRALRSVEIDIENKYKTRPQLVLDVPASYDWKIPYVTPAPWYVRVWRRILAVLGYGPFGGEQ